MNDNSNCFIWSDNWYIDNNEAWFVDGERDILCCLNLKSNTCDYAVKIPNSNLDEFRLNSRCIKFENEVFCMPDKGERIWVYNLNDRYFQQIDIKNPNKVRISIVDFWEYDNKLFAVSIGLKQVIEINIDKKVIDNYYALCDTPEKQIAKSIKVGMNIYCVSAVSNHIYQFDLKIKKSTVYTIPKAEGGFYTISFDGCKFWLSGYRKEIYIWDKENNSTNILRDFPRQFGIYNFARNEKYILDCERTVYDTPAFIESRVAGNYIWFIPFQTNKIIYVDRVTFQVNVLENEENESISSLSSYYLAHKYLVLYMEDDRYIGLFSFKDNSVLEIDAIKMTIVKKVYSFGQEYLNTFMAALEKNFNEVNWFHRIIFQKILLAASTRVNRKMSNEVGTSIYSKMMLNG